MNSNFSPSIVLAFLAGTLIGGFVTNTFLGTISDHDDYIHPIANPFDTEYHVHADFHIFIGDEQVDLSADEFMTTSTHKVDEHAHLHDGNGDVKHIHAEEVTFSAFLRSLGILLTDSCLTLFEAEPLCSDEEQEVLLYVNNELYTKPLSHYVPVDDDRILLYYGNSQDENIQTYLESIPFDSCYYSGTCPERGIAPPESCGLTCEL